MGSRTFARENALRIRLHVAGLVQRIAQTALELKPDLQFQPAIVGIL